MILYKFGTASHAVCQYPLNITIFSKIKAELLAIDAAYNWRDLEAEAVQLKDMVAQNFDKSCL